MTQQSRSGTGWRIPNSKPWISREDSDAVTGAMCGVAGGNQPGRYVAAFERELAEYLGRKYVVCVSSGTAALELAYRATGGEESARLCGAFGFVATPNAIEGSGGYVAFEDVPTAAILGDTVGIMAGESVIRDACQAFGAKLPPSLADCYSFNWNKPITCLGGGCVATDDDDLVLDIHRLRNQGRPMGRDVAWVAGTNARMSDMQAALGRSQLRRVGEILERRRQVAEWYMEMLPQKVNRPTPRDSWFLVPVEIDDRDRIHAAMQARGYQTRSTADWALHLHPYYAEKYNHKRGDFPNAEDRADRTLLLPCYPELRQEQVRELCRALDDLWATS